MRSLTGGRSGERVGDAHPDRRVGELVARLTTDASAAEDEHGGRRRQLGALTRAMASSAHAAGRASVVGGRWLTDLLVETAPRIPVRDADALRAQHPGLLDDDLAETLISGAAKATAAVGAAGGALAAVEFAAPPMLLTTPAQIAAETLLIAAVEVKLIAELHAVYGVEAPGNPRQRAAAYLVAWTNRRGVDPLDPSSLRFSLGSTAKLALRRRLLGRAGRNLSTLGPFMSGAVAGSIINHRETRRLGDQVRTDLRRAHIPGRRG